MERVSVWDMFSQRACPHCYTAARRVRILGVTSNEGCWWSVWLWHQLYAFWCQQVSWLALLGSHSTDLQSTVSGQNQIVRRRYICVRNWSWNADELATLSLIHSSKRGKFSSQFKLWNHFRDISLSCCPLLALCSLSLSLSPSLSLTLSFWVILSS